MQINQKLEHQFPRSGREVAVLTKRHQKTLAGDGVMNMFAIFIILMGLWPFTHIKSYFTYYMCAVHCMSTIRK